jgi:lipopolysaccharide transport system ATP-binding protein
MSTVISVERVSKAYRLGQIGGGTLREDVSRWWATLRGQPDPTLKIGQEHHARKMGEQFWALDNVSFEVKEGEVLGIIGRNGAGKSTLLKILSQVTTPTSGEIKIKGRIASLLEVGTGFHPELTGRENIFLNGAILGMTKAEIRRKFDEIVDFSGVEQFIDTPVKRYSSGMYVRLAFAVAAHLEPEILIVDEVLAVGDAEFQKKCIGKMQDVSRGGRTVLFVSHNMDAISRLCSNVLMLTKGAKDFLGPTPQAVQNYLSNYTQIGTPGEWLDIVSCHRVFGSRNAFFHSATYLGTEGSIMGNWPMSEGDVTFKLRISSDSRRTVPSLAVTIFSPSFQKLVNADTLFISKSILLERGLNEVHVQIQQLHLKPGRYPVGLWLANGGIGEVFDCIESAFEIDVIDANHRLAPELGNNDGVVTCLFDVHQVGEMQTKD